MEFILSIAEQLDKAASELAIDHPINDRLALILIDNAIELVLERKLSLELLSDYGTFRSATAATRKAARSKALPDRLQASVDVTLLTAREAAFVAAAHRQRNRLYHEGGGREPYIRALAFPYFRLACDLFVRLDAGFQIWIGVTEMSPIGRRYAAGDKGNILGVSRIARNLCRGLPRAPAETLQNQVAGAAEVARTDLAEAFRFLITDNPQGSGAAALLDMAQRAASRDAALRKAGLDGATRRSPLFKDAADLVRRHDETFKPRYRSIPHGPWSQAIRRIEANPDPLDAFAKFDRLMKDMQALREAIGDLALSLDRWIQSEVDRMRGK